MTSNKAMAIERYVVETHFSRVAAVELVDPVIPWERFAAAHHWWLFANARTMWMKPLKQPHAVPKGKHFESLGKLYVWSLDVEEE